MTILIADDHAINRKLLRMLLEPEGHQLVEASNGAQALAALAAAAAPIVGLIDWEMPEMEGIEVCRRARLRADAPPMFLMLLTVRDTQRDIVAGLQAGANDYLTKPFDKAELLARVKIGIQMVELQQAFISRVAELSEALARVKQLSGLLPICSLCKKVRDDRNYWQQVEEYVTAHSEAKFSHSICPQCFEAQIQPQLDDLKANIRGK